MSPIFSPRYAETIRAVSTTSMWSFTDWVFDLFSAIGHSSIAVLMVPLYAECDGSSPETEKSTTILQKITEKTSGVVVQWY